MKKNIKVLTLNKNNITDFALERNKLLNNTNSEWVLFLDSDEKLSRPITEIDDKYDCYNLRRKNYFLGNYVGDDIIIRLIKKGTGKWERKVHEVWIPNSINKVGCKDEVIIHNTAVDLKFYLQKMNYYSTLHAEENKNEGKKSTLLKIIFLPIGKFAITFLKSKDIVFSIMQSLHSFLSWAKLYFIQS